MPPKKFSAHQESIIAGWVVFRDQSRMPTPTNFLSSFIENEFQQKVSPTWIHNFLERQHLSLQRPSNMTKCEMNESIKLQAIEFVRKVRNENKKPEQIVALDKTSFYGDSRYVKDISIKGAYVFHFLHNFNSDCDYKIKIIDCFLRVLNFEVGIPGGKTKPEEART